MLPGYAILPQRWAGFPSTTGTDSQRNKNFARYREHGLRFPLTLQVKAAGCILSLCEKTDHIRVVFLISPLLFAKSCPFSGKSRLVFPRSSRATFFSSRSAERNGDTSPLFRTAFYCRPTFFPHLPTTYRREQLSFLALSICCTKQNSSNSSEDELLLFEFRNI